MEKLLSDHVALLERDYQDVSSEMKQIRSMLVVSFCEYEGRKKPPVVTVWRSLESIKGMSTTQMVVETIEAIMNPLAEATE